MRRSADFSFSFGPEGWQDIKTNPNSIWSRLSDGLGNGIDLISGFLEETALWLSSVPFILMAGLASRFSQRD